MHRFLKRLRKGLKTACLTAALTTCWSVGQTAKADMSWPPGWGEEVTFKITGTVSPTTNSLSHMYLIYGTGTSGGIEFPLGFINLGSFETNQTTNFSVYENTPYGDFMWWYTAGLYGDTSSGEYIEGTNGVTLGIWAFGGESWDSQVPIPEETAFGYLLNDTPENMSLSYAWHIDEPYYMSFDTSSGLFDFSQATANGQMEFTLEVVPEPVSIVLFGTGGMIVVALRRRKYLNQ